MLIPPKGWRPVTVVVSLAAAVPVWLLLEGRLLLPLTLALLAFSYRSR